MGLRTVGCLTHTEPFNGEGMDTDDFSEMAYAIIVQAARTCDTLKSELGAMSAKHSHADDWLSGVQEHCREILDSPDDYMEFWDLEEAEGLTAEKVCAGVEALLRQAEIVRSTPFAKR